MTNDKELEAALLACPFCGASDDELMLFCDPDEGRDNSGPSRRIQCAVCHVEAPFYDTKAEAIAAWNRRAPVSALPGEAEVVGRDIFECANQLGGYVGPNTDEELARFLIRESDAAANLANEIVRLRDALQAMQARAEAAERERDEAIGKAERQWAGWVKEEFARKAAEARVKELGEAVRRLLGIVDDSAGVSGYHLNGDVAEWDEFAEVEAARTAITGGSNG